jgi:hypothetical protein
MSPTSRRTGRSVKPKPKTAAKPAKKKAAPPRKKTVRVRAAKPVKKDRIVREKKTTAKTKTTKTSAVPAKKKPAPAAADVHKKARHEEKTEKAKPAKSKPVKAVVEKIAPKIPMAPEKLRSTHKRKPTGPSPLEDALRENDPLLEPDVLEHEVFDPDVPLIEPDEMDLVLEPEALLPAVDLPIEDLDIPLELWDPELLDVTRPAPAPAPKPPKPKPPKADKRQQRCQNCGATFTWLSVDGLCFNCLKKKVAQKRREDETFSGFTHEAEDDDES